MSLPIKVANFFARIEQLANQYPNNMDVNIVPNESITLLMQKGNENATLTITVTPDRTIDVDITVLPESDITIEFPTMSVPFDVLMNNIDQIDANIDQLVNKRVLENVNQQTAQCLFEFQQLLSCVVTGDVLPVAVPMIAITTETSLVETFHYNTTTVVNQTPAFVMAVNMLKGTPVDWEQCINASPLSSPTQLLSVPDRIEDTPINRALSDVYSSYVDSYKMMVTTQSCVVQDANPSPHIIGHCLVDTFLYIMYNYHHTLATSHSH